MTAVTIYREETTMITMTSYGTWHNAVGGSSLTLYGFVEEAVDNWPGIDVSAVADDYRAAINAALPDSVELCGDEFYGPAYEADCADQKDYPHDENGGLDLGSIIADVDLWAIVERRDTDEITIHESRMTRFSEIVDFAARRNISLEQAVTELINSGLSHQCR